MNTTRRPSVERFAPRSIAVAEQRPRRSKVSTIITTNIAFKEWGTLSRAGRGVACVGALVERFTHTAT
jgi:hypothetical protein